MSTHAALGTSISAIGLVKQAWKQRITDLQLSVIPFGVRLTWTPFADTETEIYVSVEGGAYSLVTTTGLTVGTYDYLTEVGGLHSFKVRVKDDNTVLNAPVNLSAAEITGGVRITWDDNNTEADQIEIYADIDSVGFILLSTVNIGVETYDHTIAGGINIIYKLRAKEGTLPVYSDYSATEEIDTTAIPDYANEGGIGDRTGLISISTDTSILQLTKLINGTIVETGCYFTGGAAMAGKYILFDFKAGNQKIINEIKWYQSDAGFNHGVWKIQGSNEASATPSSGSFTDIGGTFTLGNATVQTITTVSGNTTKYRHYRFLGVSGNCSPNPYLREVEFKIA